MGQLTPRPGDKFRHFKNKLYQVLTVAEHSESGEKMVVYQALYGDFRVYVRPFEMFISKTDREKYPDAEQEYRFAYIEERADEARPERLEQPEPAETEQLPESYEPEPGFGLMDFLDADSYAKKLEILDGMRKNLNEDILQAIADSLEIVLAQKDAEEQYLELRHCIQTFEKYEKSR